MLFKFNVNGVVITETTKDGRTTTLKIDSLSFEDEATAEETVEVVKTFADIAKTVRPRKRNTTKKNDTVGERYHVFVTEKWDNKNNPIHEKYIYDRKDHKYMFMASNGVVIKTTKREYSRIARAYYDESITGLDVIDSYNTNY